MEQQGQVRAVLVQLRVAGASLVAGLQVAVAQVGVEELHEVPNLVWVAGASLVAGLQVAQVEVGRRAAS